MKWEKKGHDEDRDRDEEEERIWDESVKWAGNKEQGAGAGKQE